MLTGVNIMHRNTPISSSLLGRGFAVGHLIAAALLGAALVPGQAHADCPATYAGLSCGALVSACTVSGQTWTCNVTGGASSTAYVGWHTHMASSKGDFSGTGLREDSGNESTAVASDATTRYSYWALRRLAGRTAGGLGIASSHSGATRTSFGGAIGEVIHPSSHPSTGDYGTLDRANGEQMLVILHFEDTALSPHVYVLLIDSVANKTVSICVRVSCPDTSITSVRRYPSIPDTIAHGTTGTSSSYNTGESPDWGEWYTEDALSVDYTVAAGDDPILIHSDAELDFTIPCSDVAPVAPPSAANRRLSLERLVRTGGLSGKRRSS